MAVAPDRHPFVSKHSFLHRMEGAAKLDKDVYEEVEADGGATKQAALVVGIVAVAAAIGGARGGGAGVFGFIIAAYLGWLLWSAVTYVVGAKLLGGTATWGEMLRTIGFAQSPGVFYVLAFIPLVGGLIALGVAIWLLVAAIVAIRQALDTTTGRAILTAVLGFIAYIALAALTTWIIGIGPQAI